MVLHRNTSAKKPGVYSVLNNRLSWSDNLERGKNGKIEIVVLNVTEAPGLVFMVMRCFFLRYLCINFTFFA